MADFCPYLRQKARVEIWSDKITNERVARFGYNHFISNKGEWNNCFSKFSNRVLPPIFISTILQSGKFLNLAHYFPYDVKLRLLAHSRSFLANQKARNAIVGAENLLNGNIPVCRLDVKFSHEGTRLKFTNHLDNVIHFDVLEMPGFWIDSMVDTVTLR